MTPPARRLSADDLVSTKAAMQRIGPEALRMSTGNTMRFLLAAWGCRPCPRSSSSPACSAGAAAAAPRRSAEEFRAPGCNPWRRRLWSCAWAPPACISASTQCVRPGSAPAAHTLCGDGLPDFGTARAEARLPCWPDLGQGQALERRTRVWRRRRACAIGCPAALQDLGSAASLPARRQLRRPQALRRRLRCGRPLREAPGPGTARRRRREELGLWQEPSCAHGFRLLNRPGASGRRLPVLQPCRAPASALARSHSGVTGCTP